jgi:meiosis arrest female protein 1
MSNFTTEYHKKYGRQLRLADYDSNLYQNLKELLESIPHILQILDSQYDKKLTLTHRVQVRRFSNDLIKVLKSHMAKQMFADEYPTSYEKHFGRKFEIRDYGVCYLEDMLAELPESIICRKEIEGNLILFKSNYDVFSTQPFIFIKLIKRPHFYSNSKDSSNG